MHLLLVDDHAVVRSGIRDIVNVSGTQASFTEAATAKEAMDIVFANEFDMVILDISLPDESGLRLLSKIREQKPDLPVLILSMHPEEGYAIRALKAGANGYLNKASVPSELLGAIKKILNGGTYASDSLANGLLKGIASGRGARMPHDLLSEREWHVLRLLAKGHKLTNIAEEMNVHPKTVSTYKSRIMKKLDIDNNAQLMRYALSLGLAEY